MKKTSLVLAISALLYGTSSTYVLADMSSDEIQQYLNSTPENAPLPEGDGTLGFDPPQALPGNVAVKDGKSIYRPKLKMCDTSFAVNGPAMAEFPVKVNGVKGTWSADKKTVTGPGWTLKLPVGDSWSSQWKLTVEPGTVITSILLEPFKRHEADMMWYAFDIGGKLPRYPAPRTQYEHTPDAARGQFIVQMTPGTPPPIFTATYSGPVYTGSMMEGRISVPGYPDFHGPTGDSTAIPLATSYGGPGPDKPADRKPTHDLYSTLEINFLNGGLTGAVAIDPGFGFVSDTDCLPVSEVAITSYENGVLNFTVVGEGAVAIMENAQKLVQGPFMVERGTGQATFTTPFIPTAGTCYSMMDVDTLKVMTKDYCF